MIAEAESRNQKGGDMVAITLTDKDGDPVVFLVGHITKVETAYRLSPVSSAVFTADGKTTFVKETPRTIAAQLNGEKEQ